jgi:flagella basal body P-ring formation protein FlgA
MKIFFVYILSFVLLGGGNSSQIIKKYLSSHLKGYADFNYKVVRKVPENFKFDGSRQFIRKGKFAYIPIVQLTSKGKKTYLTLKLQLFKKCFIARQSIGRGEVLSREMFDYVKTDVSGFAKTPICKNFNFHSYQTKKIIRAGEALFREDIETVPIIKSGMPVKAKFINGNVTIEFRAIARQDGWKNRIIKIKSENNKIYSAKVIDENNVLVTE